LLFVRNPSAAALVSSRIMLPVTLTSQPDRDWVSLEDSAIGSISALSQQAFDLALMTGMINSWPEHANAVRDKINSAEYVCRDRDWWHHLSDPRDRLS
jgi:hypothetical protein